MITYIKINGFKSFINFEANFTPFSVIIGVNAAGKSNLFDALKFLSRLAETDLKTAFKDQRGNPQELFTYYGKGEYASQMDFVVEMLVEKQVHDSWGGVADLEYTRLRYELSIKREKNKLGFEDLKVCKEQLIKINKNEDQWMKEIVSNYPKVEQVQMIKALRPKSGNRNKSFIQTEKEQKITLSQDGKRGRKKEFPLDQNINQTVLSSVNTVDFKHAFAAREKMRQWKFWQLNPEALRQPTAKDVGLQDNITPSGKNLAAAMFRIKEEDEYNQTLISRKLNNFLPSFTGVNVYDDKVNKQYIIKLQGEEGDEFSSRVLSEGTLRILALCILTCDSKHRGLLCFEEPENGMHAFRIKFMAELLKELSFNFQELKDTMLEDKTLKQSIPLRQVIVNTHSVKMLKEVLSLTEQKVNKTDQVKVDHQSKALTAKVLDNKSTISIWMFENSTLIAELEGVRRTVMVTKAKPVKANVQLRIPFDEKEQVYTMQQVAELIES